MRSDAAWFSQFRGESNIVAQNPTLKNLSIDSDRDKQYGGPGQI
jgi:hypothetical protein